ncbi:MAG TPA: NUDIX hydrolase [Dongiaceae bacterium]|nr:NUDIX hydrolase [Dongiaceae bacterium]
MSAAVHSVVVGCLVRNPEDKVLLIKHHKRGWEIPQGRVEAGEDLLAALLREVMEEAGVAIEPGPLAAVWSMVSLPSAIIFCFLGRYKSGELAPSGDSVEAGWFTENEALEMVAGSVMLDRLKVLLDFDGTTVYRAYTTKPYRVALEKNLGTWI